MFVCCHPDAGQDLSLKDLDKSDCNLNAWFCHPVPMDDENIVEDGEDFNCDVLSNFFINSKNMT
jgi:hypothetical protein